MKNKKLIAVCVVLLSVGVLIAYIGIDRLAMIGVYSYIELLKAKPDDIFQATEKGDIERVRKIIKKNPELVNAANGYLGSTPLYYAVLGNRRDIVEFLVQNGADVDGFGVYEGKRDLGNIPLGEADISTAKYLIEHGANVNVRQFQGMTPLYFAEAPLAEFLIAKGADVNAKDNDGRTPIHYAAEDTYSDDNARVLIAHGADVNIATNNGETPLLSAAEAGNLKVAALLLDKGAQFNAADKNGNTALHNAAHGCSNRNAIEGNIEIIKLLIAKGADVHAVDVDGDTPLHRAAGSNCPEAIDLFVSNGADVNARNKKGETPLHLAAYNIFAENPELIRKLVAAGAEVNAKNSAGETPLAYATRENRLEVAKELSKNGGTQ